MQQDYQETYNQYLARIEENIQRSNLPKEPGALYEPFGYLITSGGKRIRPVLTMIAAGAVGGDPYSALNPATAIEILHNFTLVHDDIMDNSPLRRGKPTVHKKWSEASAILVGDVMVGYAYRLLPSPSDHERSEPIHDAFTRGLIEVCEGQAYDMEFNQRDFLSMEEYFLMVEKKTARLMETAAIIGGHIGYGSDLEIEALKGFANNLGIAFQIQDDLLDLTAEQAKLGKTIGQDIIEGKKTYLIVKAFEKVDKREDRELLNKFLINNGLTAEYIPIMRDMFDKFGIIAAAKNDIANYLKTAKLWLDKLPDFDSKEMLRWIAVKMEKRNY